MIADIARVTLCEPDRLYYERQAALNLGGIAIGTGPSFYEWISRPLTSGVRYSCGVVPHYVSVDVYCINSTLHKANVPADAVVFATMRTHDRIPRAFLWPELWPIASQCGGMAVQLAAMNHKRIGLVGFCNAIDPQIDAEFRAILEFWKARGRVFVSLMKKSAFDDLLEPGFSE